MTTAWVQLGKNGDQLSALPLLFREWQRSGEKQTLIVAKPYTKVGERADYVEQVVFPGDWQDLAGAYRFAKERFSRVVCTSTHGNGFPIQKRRASFQLDQWDRAAALGDWDTLPLELAKSKFAAQVPAHCILLGDHSESSPFDRIGELEALLRENFPSHEIVKLSGIKLSNPCDFLALYEKAEALVTVETMHLHLSKASKVPTIALVTDKPSRWHGSAYSKRFRAHVRYSDFDNRKDAIVRAIKASPLTPEPIPFAPPLTYNPSTMRVGDKVWTTWRHHPSKSSWRTVMTLHDGEKALPISVDGFEGFSHEDARFFEFKGKPHLGLTIARSSVSGQSMSPCVTGYGELSPGTDAWTIRNFQKPRYGRNDFDGQEKNVVYFDFQGKLHCIWQMSPEHVVLELDGERVVKVLKSECPPCGFGLPRGGTQPMEIGNRWLRFCHVNQQNPKSDQPWTYHIAAVEMQPHPPFAVTRLSNFPIATGTEQYFAGHAYWKPRVLIPYGAIAQDGGWWISCGVNDSQCATIKVGISDLNL